MIIQKYLTAMNRLSNKVPQVTDFLLRWFPPSQEQSAAAYLLQGWTFLQHNTWIECLDPDGNLNLESFLIFFLTTWKHWGSFINICVGMFIPYAQNEDVNDYWLHGTTYLCTCERIGIIMNRQAHARCPQSASTSVSMWYHTFALRCDGESCVVALWEKPAPLKPKAGFLWEDWNSSVWGEIQ